MNTSKLCRIAVGVTAILLILSCGNSQTAVTEGGNTGTIAGRLIDSTGAGVAGALIQLRPAGYVTPVTATNTLARVATTVAVTTTTLPQKDVYTDATGAYLIDSLPVGSYSLAASYKSADGLVSIANVWDAELLSAVDTLLVDYPLRPTGSLRGVLSDSLQEIGYEFIQIVGQDRLAKIDSSGRFYLESVPAGYTVLRLVGPAGSTVEPRTVNVVLGEDQDRELGEIKHTDGDSPDVVEIDSTGSGI